jgi:hypothetical protein
LLLNTYRTFGCENSQPTYRYSLLDGVKDGYLINPTGTGYGLSIPPDPPRGAFVAMCRLVDVVTESDDRWCEGE